MLSAGGAGNTSSRKIVMRLTADAIEAQRLDNATKAAASEIAEFVVHFRRLFATKMGCGRLR
jgi:hypothetical protein